MATTYNIISGTGIYSNTFATADEAIADYVARKGAVTMLRDGVFKHMGCVYEVGINPGVPVGVHAKTWRAEQQAAAKPAAPYRSRGPRDALWYEHAKQYGAQWADVDKADRDLGR